MSHFVPCLAGAKVKIVHTEARVGIRETMFYALFKWSSYDILVEKQTFSLPILEGRKNDLFLRAQSQISSVSQCEWE